MAAYGTTGQVKDVAAPLPDPRWSAIAQRANGAKTIGRTGNREGGSVVTVFNVKGNTYRLLTRIAYPQQIVFVLDLLTHAEYDKNAWKDRL
jgi:hypothetical protein